jgi:hypothetical protein
MNKKTRKQKDKKADTGTVDSPAGTIRKAPAPD